MKKFYLVFLIALFFIKCDNSKEIKRTQCDLPLMPYELLYRDSIQGKDSLYFKVGIILLKDISKDSLYNYCSYFQSIIETCKVERLSYAEFYKNKNEPNDSVALLGKKTGLYGNFFIAKVDALKYGKDWMTRISKKDIDYYKSKNSIVIKPKLPSFE